MTKAILAAILISAIVFGQLSSAQTQQSTPPQPSQTERVLIDAYDAAHINGLVFITGQQNAIEQNIFGLRFLISSPGGIEVSPLNFEFGRHAPDGKFAHISWQPRFDPKTTVTLRWHRTGKSVVGQLSALTNVRLTIDAYRPWSDGRDGLTWAVYSAEKDNRTILGEQIHNQKIKAPLNRFLLKTDRAGTASTVNGESANIPSPSSNVSLVFDLNPNAPVSFVAAVGDEFETIEGEVEKLAARPAAELLDKAEKEYAAIGAATGGALGDSFEVITRATMWNRFYSPGQRYEYVTPHRFPGGLGVLGDAIGESSLLLSVLTGLTDGESAMASLRILLSGQTPDGRVPLKRYQQIKPAGESPVLAGRSMQPLGALAVFKVYLATQDLAFLAWAYPRLQQWNNWWHANRVDDKKWRDGNRDGLLENGFDAELEYGALGTRLLTNANKLQMALAEAGLSTSEAKFNDEVHTLTISPIALNSLYALDTELMALISREMGLTTEADRWQTRYDEIKRLINDHLWSEDDKLYLDRHWDGKFSSRRAPDLLLPLIAGIPDQPRAKLLLDALRESKELSAINEADQAIISYLIYLGMKRYGFEKQAAELAQQNLKAAGLTKPALNPQRPALAPLLYLPAIEEVLAADPWFGLTFGNLNATEEARVERVKIAGASFDVTIGPKRTVIRRDGKIEVEFEGPVKLRSYRSNDRVMACLVETKAEVRANIPGDEGKKITASIDEKVLGSTSIGAAASFKIKEGSHKLLVVK